MPSFLAGAALGSLVVKITADLTNLEKNLGKAANETKSFSQKTAAFAAEASKVLLGVGAAAITAAGLAVRSAIEFESAFAGVRKTVDATEEEFKQLEENILEMSRSIPVAATELARIQEVAGQLGVRGVENLTKFTKTIAMLGATTNITGETGSLQLTRFLSIIGESEKNIDRTASAIVDLGNNFRTQEAELLDLALNLASFGAQIGLSADQVLAFATAIKSAGGESQAASTAFQKVALKMKDAVITGSSSLIEFAKIAGVTTTEFKEAFEKDAAGALVLFLEGLERIDDAGESVTQALEKIGLADVRLVREFGKVIQQTDTLNNALDTSASAWEENNALQVEFEKRASTTASKIELIKNNVEFLRIEIGNKLLPVFEKFLKLTKEYVDFVTGADIKTDKLSILLKAHEDVNARIAELKEKAAKSAIGDQLFLEEINRLERERAILAGKIHAEKVKIAEIDAQNALDLVAPETGAEGDGALPGGAEGSPEELLQLPVKFSEVWSNGLEQIKSGLQTMQGFLTNMVVQFHSGFSSALTDIITGTKSANDAFKDFGKQMLRSIVDFFTQWLTYQVMAQGLQVIMQATVGAMAAGLAAAWAPAAALASLATAGSNAAPAQAGLTSTVALAEFLAVPKFAEGGIVDKPTLALIGEEGPEAVVPLKKGAGGGSFVIENIEVIINGNMDENLIPDIASEIGLQIEAKLRGAV